MYYIRGILGNDSRVLEELYRKFLPPFTSMLRKQGGGNDDARDVFQEALVVVFHHAARPGFQLTAAFQAYLFGIGKFIWLRQRKKNSRIEVTSEPQAGYDIDADLEHRIMENEKRMLFREKFLELGADCRQLLQRFFDREPLAKIASDMGYTDDYIKKKNRVCKEKLVESIEKDRRYKEIATVISA